MLLSRGEALACLRRRRLVPAGTTGDRIAPRVTDVSRRNRAYRVTWGRGPAYLLKQGGVGDGPGTVVHEASVYRSFRSVAARDVAARYIPPYRDYDPRTRILITEIWPRARTLREHQVREGGGSFVVAARLAEALAAIHRLPPPPRETVSPWWLAMDRPGPWILRHASAGAIEVIRRVQGSRPLRGCLEVMRSEWRPRALIHGDLRWDNCLVRRRVRSGDDVEIRIVDWEFAGPGDPAWDVGFVLGEYLAFWLLSIPHSPNGTSISLLDWARYPLESLHPALEAFWSGYARERGIEGRDRDEELARAVRYAAVRLIQIGFERLERSDSLTVEVDRLLTLAANMAERPLDAAGRLLDLPVQVGE